MYYQRSYIVEEYLDELQFLILEANYTNLHTIAVKFYRGIHTTIQNQIMILLVSRPDDTDLMTWFEVMLLYQKILFHEKIYSYWIFKYSRLI